MPNTRGATYSRTGGAAAYHSPPVQALTRSYQSGTHREMDPNDRRRVLIHASPEGARKAFGLFDDLYGAAGEMYGRYEERDLRMLFDLLRAYRQLIAEHTATLRRGS